MRRSGSFFRLVATVVAGMTVVLPAAARTQAGGAPSAAAPQGTPGGATQKPAARPVAPAGDAQKGQRLFTSYGCYECHGREAQGSTATGPRLAPRPIAFAAFTKYVRGPSGQMPPYTSKVVSDADLADIYAFLQSRPQPPAADSIPLLK